MKPRRRERVTRPAHGASSIFLLRRKPARAAVAPAQRPRGSAFELDIETRLLPRFRPGIAPPVGARIADGASVAQAILEFPYPLFDLDWRFARSSAHFASDLVDWTDMRHSDG
jgi:hypothetical protein